MPRWAVLLEAVPPKPVLQPRQARPTANATIVPMRHLPHQRIGRPVIPTMREANKWRAAGLEIAATLSALSKEDSGSEKGNVANSSGFYKSRWKRRMKPNWPMLPVSSTHVCRSLHLKGVSNHRTVEPRAWNSSSGVAWSAMSSDVREDEGKGEGAPPADKAYSHRKGRRTPRGGWWSRI